MIPIRDINPRVKLPVVNYGLMLLCALAFLYQLSLGAQVDALIRTHGFVPDALQLALQAAQGAGGWEALVPQAQAILGAIFLHGGWFHIVGNLIYLRVFGDNLEDRFGHVPYLLFFIASGFAGAVGQYLFEPNSTVPMIGASGAIAGVLGAYMVMFPSAKVVTLFPVFVFLTFIEVPAVLFLGIWAAQQLLNGYFALGTQGESAQIAWFAHLGGLAFGCASGLGFRLLRRVVRRPAQAPAPSNTTTPSSSA